MGKHSVNKASGVISAFTMLSRCLGLVRDILMAGFFGTSIYMSAFVIAFMIPNLFRRLFGEGALSAAFVPVFIEARKRDGDSRAWLLARRIITLIGSFLALVVLLGLGGVTLAMSSGGLNEMTAAVLPLLRIMLPYMLFICLAALAMAILNAFRHFAVPAAMPCLLNIIWISALLFVVPESAGVPEERIAAVAWAVLIAGAVQLLGQLPALWKRGYRPGLDYNVSDPKVRRVFVLMGPAALGLAVTQVNVLVDKLLAGWIGTWAPAALFFSERLIYLPLGIFATAMGTVLLPTLSEHVAGKEDAQLRDTLTKSISNILFVLIPAAVGLFILAGPIIQLLFEWKQFGSASTAQTAIALKFYAPGLIVFGLAKLLVPAFYAHQNTRTPVRLSVMTVGINLALNLTFVLTWPTHIKHAGLALGTVLAETFYVFALALSLKRQHIAPVWGKVFKHVWRALAAAAVMAAVTLLVHLRLGSYLQTSELPAKMNQLINVSASIVAGAAIYFAVILVMHFCFRKRKDDHQQDSTPDIGPLR